MAPEQCRGIKVDHRADIYSLGCILFECLAGRPPFEGEGVGDVLASHIHVPAPLLTTLMPSIPEEVGRLVASMLQKDPSARPDRAEAVMSLVDGAREVVTGSQPSWNRAAADSAPRPAVTTLGASASGDVPPARGRRRGIAAGLGVSLAIVVIGLVIASRSTSAPAPSRGSSGTTTTAGAVPPPPPLAPPELPAHGADAGQNAPDDAADAAVTVAVSLETRPSGADVVIAGVPAGRTPYRGTLPRGTSPVVLSFSLAGYKSVSLSVVSDRDITRVVTLPRRSAKPDATPGDSETGSTNPFK